MLNQLMAQIAKLSRFSQRKKSNEEWVISQIGLTTFLQLVEPHVVAEKKKVNRVQLKHTGGIVISIDRIKGVSSFRPDVVR